MSTETQDVITYADAVDEALSVILSILHVETASGADTFTPGLTLLQTHTGAATDTAFADAYAVQGSIAVATDSVQGLLVTTLRTERARASDSAWAMVSEFGTSSVVGTDEAAVTSDVLGASYGVASDVVSATTTAIALGVSSGEAADSPYIIAVIDFTNGGVASDLALAPLVGPGLFVDAALYTEFYAPTSIVYAATFADVVHVSDTYDARTDLDELFIDSACARDSGIQTISPGAP